jgi:hypothetical protein
METNTNTNTNQPVWKRALIALRADNALRYDAPDAPQKWSPSCLAGMADCSSPDTEDGRDFLIGVAERFCETVEWEKPEDTRTIEDFDSHESASENVPVYNHRKWSAFCDLGAYSEDVSDFVDSRKGITGDDIANAALYLIACRLFDALAQEYIEKLEAELEADEQAEADEE